MNYAAWAEWYDVVYATEGDAEVDFYVGLARKYGGPVLEIGAGTGRIAIPTASAGIDVLGIDLSPEMLRVARQRAASTRPVGKIEFATGDMREFELDRRFKLVTIPARTLLLATSAESQLATLANAARHVAPGGILALNVFVPDPQMLADTNRSPFFWDDVTNPANGRRCLLWALNRFDTSEQLNEGLQIIEELGDHGEVLRKAYLDVLLRYIYPSELRLMLEKAGLEIVDEYGDFFGSPFEFQSSEQVCVCRVRGS